MACILTITPTWQCPHVPHTRPSLELDSRRTSAHTCHRPSHSRACTAVHQSTRNAARRDSFQASRTAGPWHCVVRTGSMKGRFVQNADNLMKQEQKHGTTRHECKMLYLHLPRIRPSPELDFRRTLLHTCRRPSHSRACTAIQHSGELSMLRRACNAECHRAGEKQQCWAGLVHYQLICGLDQV
jgi:hypothetical protein